MSSRKLLLYVALLAIIIGGAPYITGYLAEAKFKEVVKVISDIDSGSIEIVKYERGWRHSFAQTKVTFSSSYSESLIKLMSGLEPSERAALEKMGLSVLLDHKIQHGPFVQIKQGDWKNWRLGLAAFHSQVLLSDEVKQILEKILGQTKLIDIQGIINIEGAVQVSFESLPIKLSADSMDYFNWKGGEGDWKLSRDMKNFEVKFNFPGVMSKITGKTFSFDEISGHYNEHKSPEGLWLGTIKLGLESITVKDALMPANDILVTKFMVDSESGSQMGLVAATGNMGIQEIKIGDKVFGPLTVESSVKKVDGSFLKSLMDFSKNPPNVQTEMIQQITSKIPNLLKNRPEFNMDKIILKTPDGEVRADLHFAMGGEDVTNINNTTQVIQSVSAKVNAIFPKPILVEILMKQSEHQPATPDPNVTPEQLKQQATDKVNATIAAAIKDGYLVEKENNYLVDWAFSEGQFKVNGKPMAFPMGVQQAPPSTTASPVSVTQ